MISRLFLPYTLSPVPCFGHWNLELGIYLEFGIYDLEFYSYPLRGRTNQIRQDRRMICAASSRVTRYASRSSYLHLSLGNIKMALT